MAITPANFEEVSAALRESSAQKRPLPPIDLTRLSNVVDHTPEDMTITVEAGLNFAAFQQLLATHNQWLPIDPPCAENLTLADILNRNLSGPRRCGYGTIRDYLIGMRVALADGRIIKSGGKVVKNVAGYDLAKLFIGAQGALGLIVEASFKVLPRPEAEVFLTAPANTFADVEVLRAKVRQSPLRPCIFDAYENDSGQISICLGFDGAREDVAAQQAIAQQLGFTPSLALNYWSEFWTHSERPRRISVLPSRTVESLVQLFNKASSQRQRFVAHLANGIIFHRQPTTPPAIPLPELTARAKAVFDPHGIFPIYSP
ncbi:MAG TPA: FAD-binding oxidoreductase [Methylomirabilota bacterium]|nr:FAD-binding oxidoreductase [Methylomirabilota bacterium]